MNFKKKKILMGINYLVNLSVCCFRVFMNGKFDLTEVEGLGDLIYVEIEV